MMTTIQFWGGKKEDVSIRIIRFLLGNINACHFFVDDQLIPAYHKLAFNEPYSLVFKG